MTTLIRVYKRKQFVVVETPTVEDTRLSWAARGILIYLLAKPDDWKVIVSNLVNSGDLKRDGILKRINELMKFGYIQRNKLRDKKGRILGTEYIVYERPHPDNPDTDFPVTALPATANSSLPNKQNTHEQKIELNTTTTIGSEINIGEKRLCFSDMISTTDKTEIEKHLAGIRFIDSQMLLDELNERLKLSQIRNVVGYMRTLVSRYHNGKFKPELGLKVTSNRNNVAKAEKARQAGEIAVQRRISEYQAEIRRRNKSSSVVTTE